MGGNLDFRQEVVSHRSAAELRPKQLDFDDESSTLNLLISALLKTHDVRVLHSDSARMRAASLILPETRKTIEKKGYKGIKAYLFTGYAEIAKLLLIPAKNFAVLHDSVDISQNKKRVQRTRIVKTMVLSLTLSSTLVLALFLPPAAGLIPFIAKYGILLLITVISTVFWGITVHAVNNFIEDVHYKSKKANFTAYITKLLESEMYDCSNLVNIDLPKDVQKMLDDKLYDYHNSTKIDLEKDVQILLNNKEQM